MCGIIGIWAKNKNGELQFQKMPSALKELAHRGPDNQSIKTYSKVCLGHARLSVIDLEESANQPMSDSSDRYHLVFNGEIYNYKELREQLIREGVQFKTQSDTEVLLYMLIHYGEKALEKLNGFFAFIFYDQQHDKILYARDRMGIKPLVFYEDEDKIILTSELHALFRFDIEKSIDEVPFNEYFRLTYIAAPNAILKNTYKVKAGHLGVIDDGGPRFTAYYENKRQPMARLSFQDAADELRSILTTAVKKRLVADVPLGTFLSGGLDSSIISAIARKHKEDLKTFSIGFDHEYFNESDYARKVAKHIGSDHYEFILTRKHFKENFGAFLDAIDEPFGDSSAFAMYLLARETKKHVTVALSGDGADELFAGYRKHRAEMMVRDMTSTRKMGVKAASGLLAKLRVSRSDKFGDLNRKLQKLGKGVDLSNEQRYFEWCSFISQEEATQLIQSEMKQKVGWTGSEIYDMSDYLIADQKLVLANDMLKKVDLMSMAHALEVRTPFLDHNVVEFANSLPFHHKLDMKTGKLILKHAFESMLPPETLNRKKQGFEIPIQDWLGDEIQEVLSSDLFSKAFIEEQNLFNYGYVKDLCNSVKSKSFGEKIYVIWSLIIFQHWYKKYFL
ncbi:MAG: asparagine synthase (glutamine-hydrolyzing) [Crocinitomicaceae bacterium]|nr:asparagine synthase (glutamine-hydrolyzing) [Crocinitomicaceae bacterium]